MTQNRLDWIQRELDALAQKGLRRHRRVRSGSQQAAITLDGRQVVNFGSNDYLGLAADERLAKAAADAACREGWGSGASPLVTGYGQVCEQLERSLADFEQREAALVFGSGFAANAGTIAALVGPGDMVLIDRLSHASLLDGCRLSRADVRIYPHNDCDLLRRQLDRPTTHRRLIVTDSLFSIDGDLGPLEELADLADRYGAMLLVDEAHATGVFGAKGRGVAEHLGVHRRVDVLVGTLSKALGCVGGFVSGSRQLVDYLVQRARPYVFSTAGPAALAAAASVALQIVEREPHRRQGLLQRAADLRQSLQAHGWNVGKSASQIIPIVVGEPERALTLSNKLLAEGFYVPAIRPPTVPEGQCCLRISLTAAHTEEMVAGLVAVLGRGNEG